jgi:hypothetical protein
MFTKAEGVVAARRKQYISRAFNSTYFPARAGAAAPPRGPGPHIFLQATPPPPCAKTEPNKWGDYVNVHENRMLMCTEMFTKAISTTYVQV